MASDVLLTGVSEVPQQDFLEFGGPGCDLDFYVVLRFYMVL